MGKTYCNERNPNWRGGRVLASNGYILVRVGLNHHLADVRGYAYEHRIVCEEKIGRRLLRGEQVHHIDGNKTNNSPENLEVAANRASHAFFHRKRTDLREPNSENRMIKCKCGCGKEFLEFDKTNRPRKFLPSHNLLRSIAELEKEVSSRGR